MSLKIELRNTSLALFCYLIGVVVTTLSITSNTDFARIRPPSSGYAVEKTTAIPVTACSTAIQNVFDLKSDFILI